MHFAARGRLDGTGQPRSHMPAKKMPPSRLPAIPERDLTSAQRALIDSIRSGPRGQFKMSGPFYCYLHAPAFGELAQELGAHCRFGTSLPPRLSELAILATAQRHGMRVADHHRGLIWQVVAFERTG